PGVVYDRDSPMISSYVLIHCLCCVALMALQCDNFHRCEAIKIEAMDVGKEVDRADVICGNECSGIVFLHKSGHLIMLLIYVSGGGRDQDIARERSVQKMAALVEYGKDDENTYAGRHATILRRVNPRHRVI